MRKFEHTVIKIAKANVNEYPKLRKYDVSTCYGSPQPDDV